MGSIKGNILFVGVGGQGVLLASEIAARVALACGLDAKKSEVHGMAQRGGIVYSHVRFGQKVYSPLIDVGCADILVAFEEAEAVRWQHYLSGKGASIINKKRILPPSAFFTGDSYPEEIASVLSANERKFFIIDAEAIASKLGNIKVANSALLGALSNLLEFPDRAWIKTISELAPPKTAELNTKAFLEGKLTIKLV